MRQSSPARTRSVALIYAGRGALLLVPLLSVCRYMPVVRCLAGLPLLVLEGDCTSRSLGQQTTRIEAFVEMLT